MNKPLNKVLNNTCQNRSTTKFCYEIEAIGYCRSPYKQKFGIPRQPGLVNSAKGYIELISPYNQIDCVRGIEQYSHLWINFCFHENRSQGWKPLVRPPRLGGNEKLGVFATRSTFRPNAIGQSVVKLERVIHSEQQLKLEISGMDLLDGTPIIDIKPYIPFSDAINTAHGGIAHNEPEQLPVTFSQTALQSVLNKQKSGRYPKLQSVITEVLSQDPRPAYKKAKQDSKQYQVALYDLDILWHVDETGIVIDALVER